MRISGWLGPVLLAGLVAGVAAPPRVRAQDDSHESRGRKYKAPPATAHIEVLVLKGTNKKPIMNAAVIFHPIDADGKDEGTLEVKSGPDGKASIDVIPIGSEVRVQVLANGFATYAEDLKIESPTRSLTVSMLRPQAQISAYQDNQGKPAEVQPGIQEPVRNNTNKKDGSGSGTTSSGSAKPDSGSGSADSSAGSSNGSAGPSNGSAGSETKP